MGLRDQVIISRYATMNRYPVTGWAGKKLNADSVGNNSSKDGSIGTQKENTQKDRGLFQKVSKASPGATESLVKRSRFANDPVGNKNRGISGSKYPLTSKNRVIKLETPKSRFLEDASIRMENRDVEIGLRK